MSHDSEIKSNIGLFPVNVYYSKTASAENVSESKSEDVWKQIDNLRQILEKYESDNKKSIVVTYGLPTTFEYQKINKL